MLMEKLLGLMLHTHQSPSAEDGALFMPGCLPASFRAGQPCTMHHAAVQGDAGLPWHASTRQVG